jgi:peroxiredoxin
MPQGKIEVGEKARDFMLEDTHGEPVTLSGFEGKKNVYLVLNRGFV